MALERQLERWKRAGLIEPAQAERIALFEQKQSRPTVLYAIGGLGGLAMAIGLVSIVAANWDVIPGRVKLGLDLACLLGSSFVVLRLMQHQGSWLREAAIVAFYGLTLASIALVGQVYQLGGSAAAALSAWSLLSFLLMAQGRSAFVASAWLTGLELTIVAVLFELAEQHRELSRPALLAVYWAPLLCLAVGRSRWLARLRPAYADVFCAVGSVELVALSSAGTLGFYDEVAREGLFVWLVALLSLAGTAWLWAATRATPEGRAWRWVLLTAFAVGHVPLLVPHGGWPVAAALAFIGLWWVVAVAAHRSGRGGLLHLATALIGVRLLIAYFEVFGSLMSTGVGLVTGGVLTLLLTWIWARKRRDFARELPGPVVARAPAGSEERPP